MIIVEEVDLFEVQRHELATEANAKIGGYRMDLHCPMHEFRCYRAVLESSDLNRLFVMQDFASLTVDNTCRLRDVMPIAGNLARVKSFTTSNIDLRLRDGLELMLVGSELFGAPLTAIDGNHRMIAQYLTYYNVNGVSAYICIHPAMSLWPYVPPLARTHTIQP